MQVLEMPYSAFPVYEYIVYISAIIIARTRLAFIVKHETNIFYYGIFAVTVVETGWKVQ